MPSFPLASVNISCQILRLQGCRIPLQYPRKAFGGSSKLAGLNNHFFIYINFLLFFAQLHEFDEAFLDLRMMETRAPNSATFDAIS
jgi:hypothetical protein